MDAVVRSGEFPPRHVASDEALSGGGAIIKVLHHYDQFTTERLRLDLMGADGGDRRAEPVRQEVITRLQGPLGRKHDFRLKGTHRRRPTGSGGSVGSGRLVLVSLPPAEVLLPLLLLLQVFQTRSDRRAAQLEEEEGGVRMCDVTV